LAALKVVLQHWTSPGAIVRVDGQVVLKTDAWDCSCLADIKACHLCTDRSSRSNGNPPKRVVCLLEALIAPDTLWYLDATQQSVSIAPIPIEGEDEHYLVTIKDDGRSDVAEGRLNVALDSMRGGLWDWVRDGDDFRIYRSARICEILGINGYVTDGTRDEWVDRIHPDDRADVVAKVEANFKGETPIYIADYRIKAANGEWIFIHDHGCVIERHPDGTPRRWVGICADVTDMVQLQQTAQGYKAQLELALNSFKLELWEYDADRRMVYLSPQLARRFGFTESPCIKPDDDLFPLVETSDLDGIRIAFDEFLNGKETFDAEARIGLPGNRRWCRISASRNTIRDDGALWVAGAVQDIHARKRYEFGLIDGEAQFRRMADAAPVFIWLGDQRTGDCTFVNSQWVTETGVAISHLLGEGWLEQVHPADRAPVREAIERVCRKYVSEDINFRLLTERREYAHAVGRISVRYEALCEPVGLLMIAVDATPLQLAKTQLALALDAAQAGLWDWRINEDEVFTIARTHTMLGEPIPEEPIGLDWFTSRLHPQDRSRVIQEIRAAHENPDYRYRVTFRFRMFDGTYKWIESTGRVTERDVDGNPLRMIGLHIDIDELKQAESQLTEANDNLRATRSRLQDMLEHAPASVAMFDRDMCYLVASQRWKEDYGLVGEPIIGQCHYDVFPEIGPDWKAIHNDCLKGAVRRCEEDRFDRSDGSVQYLRWEVRPWYDRATGDIGGIAMYTEDITARKLAKELVHDAYAQESAIFSASRDPLLMVGTDGNIKKASNTVDQVFGCGKSDIIGTPVVELFEDLAPRLKCHSDGSLDESHLLGIAGRPFEVSILHRSGQSIAGEVNISPLQLPGSNSIQFVASVRDISDRKRIESEREQQVADMSHLSRLAVVDLMGIELAHEFRQPLGAIRNYVYSARLKMKKDAEVSHVIGPLLDEIETAVAHMTSLIESIRQFGKKPEKEHCDIAVESIVDGALNLAQTRLRSIGVRPLRNIGAVGQRVRGDIVQLQQIVLNLILNAVDALEEIDPSQRELRIYAEPSGGKMVKLSICDSGRGVDPAIAESLFESFQSTNPSSLGMGLSISKQLAEAHGGDLLLERGKPTTFALYLPTASGADE